MKKLMLNVLALILTFSSFSAIACQGAIVERGSNRKIVYCQEGKNVSLKLLEREKEIKNLRLEVRTESVADIDPNIHYNKNRRSKSITEGYYDVTYMLASTLNMGMLILFPVTGAVYLGYSLSYIYTLPVDMLSKENIAYRKLSKLIQGEEVKASKKVFNYLEDSLF